MNNNQNDPNSQPHEDKSVEPIGAPVAKPQIEIKYPREMYPEAQTAIEELEKELGGPVICYYTNDRILGDDVKYFYNHLKNFGHVQRLYFVLRSSGGDGTSAYRIANLLRNYCDELYIVLPEMSASAATMLCLAADQLLMTPLAYLTAVDTSLVHKLNPKDKSGAPVKVELEEVDRALNTMMNSQTDDKDKFEVYKTLFTYLHPVAYGSIIRASKLSEMLCKDIIALRNNEPNAEETDKLIHQLNHVYPVHGYPITISKARDLGLPVSETTDNVNSLLWDLSNSYRICTEKATTKIDDSTFHYEEYDTIIESKGKRSFVRESSEERLDAVMKGWTFLFRDYIWETIVETTDENGEKKLRIVRL